VLTIAFVDFAWSVFVVSGEVAIAPIALPMGVLMDFSPAALVDHSLGLLAVNSLGELIFFRLIGRYVNSSGMLIPALWVHLSPLDFAVGMCTLDLLPAPPVGPSLSLKVVSPPTTYLL